MSVNASAVASLAATAATFSPGEVYTAKFVTSLTAPITSGLRPTVISVAATQAAFGSGTFSIAIYNAGTDASPVNFEALEVTGGGSSLNWTVVTEQGWNPATHASGSTVVATVFTPRSITQPLNNHTSPLANPDPHSIYVRKSGFSGKGQLLVGTGNGTFTNLPVGANGTVPLADSTQVSGIRWMATSLSGVLAHMGDLLVGGVLGAAQRLGIGTVGQVLTVVANPAAVATPILAPTCSATGSGGLLTNGQSYTFGYAWRTANAAPDGGITAISPTTAFAATTTGQIAVQCPAAPTSNLTLIIYANTTGSGLQQQAVMAGPSTSSVNTVTISAIVAGASPSATNTTGGISSAWSTSSSNSFTESATAPALTNGGTIATAGVTETRLSPITAVTGIVLQAGTIPGQEIMVVNEAVLASSITFVDTTGNVQGGSQVVIPGTTARKFVWDSVIAQWFSFNAYVLVQSATATVIVNGSAIATQGVTEARVAPASAVNGITMAAGVTPGQEVIVTNESAYANSVTFAIAATSLVADGANDVIPGGFARKFAWDSVTSLWYPSGWSNPMTTAGDLVVGGTSGLAQRLASGTTGLVLTSTGVGAAPSWQAIPTSGGSGTGSGGTGGSIVPIQTQTPSGTNTATFTVPAGFKNLRVTGTARSTKADVFDTVQIQFNADTGANYNQQRDYATGNGSASANIGATQATAQTSGLVAFISAANSLATAAGRFVADIPDHTNTTFFKGWLSHDTGVQSAIATGVQENLNAGYWSNTAAVTSVTLLLASGNYVAGSSLTLWGEADTTPLLLPVNSNLIQETILNTAQSSIPIANIPQGYRDLRVVIEARSSGAGATSVIGQINGDTTAANYTGQQSSAQGNTTSGAAIINGRAGLAFGDLPGTSTADAAFAEYSVSIPDYAGVQRKASVSIGGTFEGASQTVLLTWSRWTGTAAITSLNLVVTDGSNFVAGTAVRVYGEPAAAGGISVGTGTRLRNSTNQAGSSGSPLALAWDTEDNDADNQHNTSSASLTGALTTTAGSQTVTGIGTAFTTQLSVGQVIQLSGSQFVGAALLSAAATMAPSVTTNTPGAALLAATSLRATGAMLQTVVVTGIASNTSLTISTPAAVTASNLTASYLNTAVVFRTSGFYTHEIGVYSAALASGTATLQLRLNGSTIVAEHDEAGVNASAAYDLTCIRQFLQWDYVEALWTQSSGGTVNVLTDERTHWAVSARPTMVVQTPVMGASGVNHAAGLTPDPGAVAGALRFLREDATWQVPPGTGGGAGAAGALAAIQTQNPVGSATATFTVPTGYRNLRITWEARSSSAVTQTIGVQFNGDTTATYDVAFVENNGGTAVAGNTLTAQTSGRIGMVPGTGTTAGRPSSGVCTILDCAGTTFEKTFTATGFRPDTPASETVSGIWHNPAAITSVSITLSAGSFPAGSTVTLWGESDTATGTGGSGTGSGGTGGSVVPIQTQTPSGVSTLTFAVPTGFKNLRFTGQGRSAAAAALVNLQIQFNGDTGANYSNEVFNIAGTVATASRQTAQTSGTIAFITAATALANAPTSLVVDIPNHSGTTFLKAWLSRINSIPNAAIIGQETDIYSGSWSSSAAITSVTVFTSDGSNFVAGSTFTLWGEADTAPVLLTSNSNLIQETILTSAQASIPVPSIPQGYKDLRITWDVRGDAASTATGLLLQFNGDTSASYDWQAIFSNAASNPTGGDAAAQTALTIAEISAGTAPANASGTGQVTIHGYAGTTFRKGTYSLSELKRADTAGNPAYEIFAGEWRNTAAITSAVLSTSTGNFATGSTIRVYGEPAAAAGPSVGTGTQSRITAPQSIASGTPATINWTINDNDADNDHLLNPAPGALSGTVAKVTGQNILTGTGTTFLTQVAVGQVITVPGVATETFVVIAIASATQLTINGVWANSASGQTATTVNTAFVIRQPGMYEIDLSVFWASATTGVMTIQLRLNGTTIFGQNDSPFTNTALAMQVGDLRQFQQWDYIEAIVTQTTGGPLNVTADARTHFSMSGRPTVIVAVPYINIQDQQASGNSEGATSGAFQQRTLNTVVSDSAGIASLATSQITLPPGTYRCAISAPACQVGKHQARLQNITDSTAILLGTSEYSEAAANISQTRSVVAGRFVLTGSKTLAVQHRVQTTNASFGFGVAGSFGTEVYTVLELWKEG